MKTLFILIALCIAALIALHIYKTQADTTGLTEAPAGHTSLVVGHNKDMQHTIDILELQGGRTN